MIWFKHPNDLPNDKRLASLIDNEGCRGAMVCISASSRCSAHSPTGNSVSVNQILFQEKGSPENTWRKLSGNTNFSLSTKKNLESAINFNNMEKEIIPQNNLKLRRKRRDAKNGDNPLNNSGSRSKTGCAARKRRTESEKNR